MRARSRAIAVCVFLVLSSLILIAPKAAASWCTQSFMSYSPNSGSAGTYVTFSFTFENGGSATIQVSDFSVTYSWGGFSDFGVFVVGPYESVPGTSTQLLPSTAGSESILAAVAGQASTDYYPILCYFGPMEFTVLSGAPLSATASATPTAADVGLAVSFDCSAIGGSSPYSFSWTFGDGTSATGKTVSHSYTSAGLKTATCTATDSVGTQSRSSITVPVYPAPTVTIASTQTTAAPGTALAFNASAGGGSGSFTYTWSFGDGATASGPNVTHAYTTIGTFTVTVNAKDSVGGSASSSVVVTIASLVATAESSTTSTRPGANITFTVTAVGGAGAPYTFTWSFGDGSTGTGASVVHTYSTSGSYTPKVTVTDRSGAANTTTLATITIQTPDTLFPAGAPTVLAIGIAAAVAAIGVAVFLIRRRHAAGKSPPIEPPTPPAIPPPPDQRT